LGMRPLLRTTCCGKRSATRAAAQDQF